MYTVHGNGLPLIVTLLLFVAWFPAMYLMRRTAVSPDMSGLSETLVLRQYTWPL